MSLAGITVGSDELELEYKNGNRENFFFKDLTKVSIITTDEGPFQEDVFWLMLFTAIIIMIPQGVPGGDKLLARMQEFPGFNNEVLIKAMTCTGNDAFDIWQKEGD